ncbi:cytochrome C biogenesis protein [candidate division WWE3 bacterium CG_4_9_14_3_um_filter_41_6]|uniref:Cytochrome C biogenesis protein n=1 Tax=candidate division WWE3 bacterium CG_4_10_14_0_2_um_filter_41_14 TaxID=1975072 RepID=A0A2M7TLS2_UNCKA|nr:MAG: cytochrome C biogenesis protein [candidate division WWE3 bacterium CG_4_10_14_0_2_um_filter_41_14]PJA38675.1 MAG: cytochrome C biogenesis protein [candidate division WWE3 bacterium CG_4_9_14_3_um_filter_41_6]
MDTIFQLSLLASFIAGMVALFAPCCITFLLPAYFANVFKEKKRVVLMTFIYSLGIFTIMIPVVLGAKALTQLFFSFHDQTYIIGGVFLILVGFSSLIGFKLPMPNFSFTKQADDPFSTYLLGIISGITSACCAPVLIGVLALSTLSPTMVQSLLVGFFYVLGMVTPLYLASLLIDKRNILEKPIFRKPFREVTFLGKTHMIMVSDLISFTLFSITGLIIIYLSLSGRLAMQRSEESVTQLIQSVAVGATSFVQKIPGLDIVFVLTAFWLLYKFLKYIKREK